MAGLKKTYKHTKYVFLKIPKTKHREYDKYLHSCQPELMNFNICCISIICVYINFLKNIISKAVVHVLILVLPMQYTVLVLKFYINGTMLHVS